MEIIDVTTPDWKPLEAVESRNPKVKADDFMYMGSVDQNGTIIRMYKHWNTRRYLNIDTKGGFWRYIAPYHGESCSIPSKYISIPQSHAIEHALS